MSIIDALPADYRAPYDFDLARFTAVDGGWTITALAADGEKADYRLSVVQPPAIALLTRAHEPVTHPHRYDLGEPAPVADWVDAIAIADAAGRRVIAQGVWADEGLAPALARAEHGIVAYEAHELHARDPHRLRTWLDDTLAHTAVRVEVAALRDFALTTDGRLRDGMLLRRYDDDTIVGWLPIAVSTDYLPEQWITHRFTVANGTELRPRPNITVRMSGSVRTSLAADHVLTWSELEAHATVDHDLTDAEWLIVRIIDTDVALVVPFAHAHVQIATDDDGATVTISAEAADICEAAHRRRTDFEREWGRWLDPDVTLDDDELARGVARAETLVRTYPEVSRRRQRPAATMTSSSGRTPTASARADASGTRPSAPSPPRAVSRRRSTARTTSKPRCSARATTPSRSHAS